MSACLGQCGKIMPVAGMCSACCAGAAILSRNTTTKFKEKIVNLKRSAVMGWETVRCLAVELSAGTGKPSASERAAVRALKELEEL